MLWIDLFNPLCFVQEEFGQRALPLVNGAYTLHPQYALICSTLRPEVDSTVNIVGKCLNCRILMKLEVVHCMLIVSLHFEASCLLRMCLRARIWKLSKLRMPSLSFLHYLVVYL